MSKVFPLQFQNGGRFMGSFRSYDKTCWPIVTKFEPQCLVQWQSDVRVRIFIVSLPIKICGRFVGIFRTLSEVSCSYNY